MNLVPFGIAALILLWIGMMIDYFKGNKEESEEDES